MKKLFIVLLTLFTGVLLLSGCKDKRTEEAVAKAAEQSAKLQEAHETEISDVTKQTATQLAKDTTEVAKEAVESVKAQAEETLTKAKETIQNVVVAQAPGDRGKELYKACAGCHGEQGQKHALGKSALLAGQSASALADKLKAYKAGKRNVAGMGTLMQTQLASLQKSDILALAEYISTFQTNKGNTQ